MESPRLADFVAALEPVNALADGRPGFVWRLQTEDGDATAIRVFDDDAFIVNLSVWESLDALAAFVYDGTHRDVMRRRGEWFERLAEAHLALWWIRAGRVPTVPQAVARLEYLRAHGPSPHAFTFRVPFPSPDTADDVLPRAGWVCPTG